MPKLILLSALLMWLTAGTAFSQNGKAPMPQIISSNGRHALLVDGKPYFILGGQAHNSSGWPGMLPHVWQAIKTMHVNTLEVPLYWEQIEPQQGKFDFSIVDTLLMQARQHKVRLVLLWFGTWKNGSNHYMPVWMKQNAVMYPNITGRNGQPVDSPSPHSEAALDADIKAFSAIMRHLKKADGQHTVIMVQVENEPGSWGSVRDYSPLAQSAFDSAVPPAILKPEILKALGHAGSNGGTWAQVFGKDADEYFHAWHIANYIGKVAAAGKAEYPLPLYVNVALRDPLTKPSATTYESGGPTDNVIPIWKAAAPAIDLLAPDIYLSGTEKILKVLELYDRADNTLFVPEAGLITDNAKYLYPVIAHGGIGFAPFGIDNNGETETTTSLADRLGPFAQEFAMAAPMMRELAKWAFEGKVKAVVETEDHAAQNIDLGNWQAIVSFTSASGIKTNTPKKTDGKLMIVQLAESRFLVIGTLCHITFRPVGNNAGRAWQYLEVKEGSYSNGQFKAQRILNGDETDFGGPRAGTLPAVLQITLGLR